MAKGFVHESTHNESKEWYTPKYIFDALGVHFNLDPCSPGKEIVSWIPADCHFTIRDNGLLLPWRGNVWLNPPYGSDTGQWFKRLAQHEYGIGLVFVRSDTDWFYECAPLANAICFIHGRVPFVRPNDAVAHARSGYSKGGCGSPSMLVAFGQDNVKALLRSNLGLVMSRISKLPEMHRIEKRFAGDKLCASLTTDYLNENLPRNVERWDIPPIPKCK